VISCHFILKDVETTSAAEGEVNVRLVLAEECGGVFLEVGIVGVGTIHSADQSIHYYLIISISIEDHLVIPIYNDHL
jgi:hypothetical protein